MEYYRIDRRAMKRDARAAMREHRPSVYMVAFAFLFITFVLNILATRLQFPGMSFSEIMRYSYDERLFEQMLYAAENRSGFARLLDLAIELMTVMLTGGFALFCLRVSQRRPASVGTMFDIFGWFFRYLWLEIVTGFFIFLWSLLFVIPGIVAAYRYSMAKYVFFENPDMGALECIQASKEMTMGHKGELFVLHLSLIGWILLSAIPFVSIFTLPYMGVTEANYFRALSGRMYAQPQGPDRDPWEQQ